MSWQDVKHHDQAYDPCEHGQESRCPACEARTLRLDLAVSEEECTMLQLLLHDVWTDGPGSRRVAQDYLRRVGLLPEEEPP